MPARPVGILLPHSCLRLLAAASCHPMVHPLQASASFPGCCAFLMEKSNSFTPFTVGRQAIALKRGNCSLAALFLRQPGAELIGIFPADAHNRIIRRLGKAGDFQLRLRRAKPSCFIAELIPPSAS